MSDVAKQLEKHKLNIPLLIGGATTSKIHTAVKIEPHYSAPVIHVKDASKSVGVVSSLLSTTQKDDFVEKTRQEYENLRNTYLSVKGQAPYVTLEEARNNKLNLVWDSGQIIVPKFTGIKTFSQFPLEDIRDYISWVFFFVVWQLRGKFPDILDDPRQGEEARKLFDDANRMLDRILREKLLTANGVAGIFPANSIGDDIEVYSDVSRTKLISRFVNLRNQELKSDGSPNL
jgi:5-methyltetrahydrofolate--homocysteine methyltransferase